MLNLIKKLEKHLTTIQAELKPLTTESGVVILSEEKIKYWVTLIQESIDHLKSKI